MQKKGERGRERLAREGKKRVASLRRKRGTRRRRRKRRFAVK